MPEAEKLPVGASKVEKLSVTLEEIYLGIKKSATVTKKIIQPDGSVLQQQKTFSLHITAGWKNGTKLTFPKEADEAPKTTPGDVVFILDEKPHPSFKRDSENNLLYTANISLVEALVGAYIDIKTLDGRLLKIQTNEVVNPSFVKVVPGEGMPDPKTGKKANLLVHFNIEFPKSLTNQQKSTIQSAFM